jgi:hypothetical protein
MASLSTAKVGDRVTIGDRFGTVTRIQHIAGMMIVTAESDPVTPDGALDSLIEAIENAKAGPR